MVKPTGPQTVTLHGGPSHGQVVTVPLDAWKRGEVVTAMLPVLPAELPDLDPSSAVELRTGRYTQVANRPWDFEWIGAL